MTTALERQDGIGSNDGARQRAKGAATVAFARRLDRTRLADLAQSGALRVLFPRPEPGAPPTAVLANIGGGIAGGDQLTVEIRWGAGCEAIVTTQAAEKVYRALDVAAEVATRLEVGEGALGCWLPQETILFDSVSLERRLEADVAPDATLIACESVVFGRTARNETVARGRLIDRWRLRRGGKLVFADTLALDGAVADTLARPAIGGGATAVATLVMIAPDAEARLDGVRAALESARSEAGVSAFDGCLVARFVAREAPSLRRDLALCLEHLTGRPLPRVFAF